MRPSLDELLAALRSSWSRETSGFPEKWTEDNPARGQCSVTALVIQDYLGGGIQRFVIVDNGEDMHHVVNILPGGVLIDATAEQFTAIPVYVPRAAESREEALEWRDTMKRYELLSARVGARLRRSVMEQGSKGK